MLTARENVARCVAALPAPQRLPEDPNAVKLPAMQMGRISHFAGLRPEHRKHTRAGREGSRAVQSTYPAVEKNHLHYFQQVTSSRECRRGQLFISYRDSRPGEDAENLPALVSPARVRRCRRVPEG
jgi:hypothetical protein